ncbi:MAG TPA: hypothetical protein VK669_04430, partial [Candidatus Limnocylindrales bacterium]|nr:hypothetical protein [Candidatus Limnocylindrales bacterium]
MPKLQRFPAAFAVALLVLAGSPGAARAQAGDAASVQALAERIAREGYAVPNDVELFPGTIPPLPVPFAPPVGARVVGALVARPRSDGPATAVRNIDYRAFFTLPGTPFQATEAIAAGFAPAGYAPTPTLFSSPAGGFTSTNVVITAFCHDADSPRIVARASRFGEMTDVVIDEFVPASNTAREESGTCNTLARAPPEATLPSIRSTREVAVTVRTRLSFFPDANAMTADVRTSLAPRTVVDGWAGEATAQGWTLRSVASTDDTAFASLVRPMAGGRMRLLVISL